jgi:chitodextrinase
MTFQQYPSKLGIPSGNTAGRPTNPVIGDTYYNGQVEALEIYNGTTWKVVKSEGFPPDAPTISSVTDSSTSLAYSSTAGTLDVVFIPAGTGGTATQYNAYTTVGGHSGFTTVGTTVTITGLTPGTAYTVYGNAQNGSGTSTNTNNASPVTPTTLPEVRTIGTATASTSANEATVTWTNGNNGGKNLSSITITPFLNGTTAETL